MDYSHRPDENSLKKKRKMLLPFIKPDIDTNLSAGLLLNAFPSKKKIMIIIIARKDEEKDKMMHKKKHKKNHIKRKDNYLNTAISAQQVSSN